ncbi:MAG: transcriptional regulator, AraC family [Labilithrix sp.]|nr:transcriptional regulator, AraC family [Labilithrix sp.]
MDRVGDAVHPSIMTLPLVPSCELARGASANDVNDANVARALDAMTSDPARGWSVRELARIAGLSRAAFARRFKQELGTPPLQWLTELRVRLATTHLASSDLALAGIAAQVGYRCEFAFAKAFKRLVGVAPGVYRRAARTRVPTFRAAA